MIWYLRNSEIKFLSYVSEPNINCCSCIFSYTEMVTNFSKPRNQKNIIIGYIAWYMTKFTWNLISFSFQHDDYLLILIHHLIYVLCVETTLLLTKIYIDKLESNCSMFTIQLFKNNENKISWMSFYIDFMDLIEFSSLFSWCCK